MGIADKFKASATPINILTVAAGVAIGASIGTAIGTVAVHKRLSRRMDELQEVTELNAKVTLSLVNAVGSASVARSRD